MSKRISEFVIKNQFACCLIPPTLAGIIISSIVNNVSFFIIMPLFVSLIVMLLQSQANRYAFLLGGINSLIYAAVDFSFTLYSSAASAILISFPIQLITFIRWNKRAYKKSTHFYRLSFSWRILTGAISISLFILLNIVFYKFGSPYMFLDNIVFVTSILTYVLTLFSFIEYPIVQIIGNFVSFGMNIAIFITNPSRLPFLIYNIYSLCCIMRAAISVLKLYREQQGIRNQFKTGSLAE